MAGRGTVSQSCLAGVLSFESDLAVSREQLRFAFAPDLAIDAVDQDEGSWPARASELEFDFMFKLNCEKGSQITVNEQHASRELPAQVTDFAPY
jgi:hypothetical protein